MENMINIHNISGYGCNLWITPAMETFVKHIKEIGLHDLNFLVSLVPAEYDRTKAESRGPIGWIGPSRNDPGSLRDGPIHPIGPRLSAFVLSYSAGTNDTKKLRSCNPISFICLTNVSIAGVIHKLHPYPDILCILIIFSILYYVG